jgi:hypothetical protein
VVEMPPLSSLAEAKIIAKNALNGVSKDPTFGATHFHHISTDPRWKLNYLVTIDNHKFYKKKSTLESNA